MLNNKRNREFIKYRFSIFLFKGIILDLKSIENWKRAKKTKIK